MNNYQYSYHSHNNISHFGIRIETSVSLNGFRCLSCPRPRPTASPTLQFHHGRLHSGILFQPAMFDETRGYQIFPSFLGPSAASSLPKNRSLLSPMKDPWLILSFWQIVQLMIAALPWARGGIEYPMYSWQKPPNLFLHISIVSINMDVNCVLYKYYSLYTYPGLFFSPNWD